MTNFSKRIFSALILFLVFFISFFSKDQLFFICLISVISLVSLYEMSNLLKLKRTSLFLFWIFPLVAFFLHIFDFYNLNFLIIFSALFWIFIAPIYLLKGKPQMNFLNLFYGLIIIFGLYLSAYHLYINDRLLLLISIIIVWVADIFAFFTGKAFGKRKIAPLISPGKTFEGFYGGLISNLVLTIILSILFDYSFIKLLLLAILIIPFSLIGDLFESLLKRGAGKKDSGYFIPGHGGILDRIDGLCPTIVLVSSLSLLGFVL